MKKKCKGKCNDGRPCIYDEILMGYCIRHYKKWREKLEIK